MGFSTRSMKDDASNPVNSLSSVTAAVFAGTAYRQGKHQSTGSLPMLFCLG